MWKVIGPLNVETFYAKYEKVLVSSMTSQTVNCANLVGLVSFFSAFWGFEVSTFQKIKILGSVM